MELNGHPVAAADLTSLALHNYGHFTSMRVEDGRVRGLRLHLERLVSDCRAIFNADLDPDHIRQLVRQVVKRQPSPIIVRVTVFAPGLELGHPGKPVEPQTLVTARPAPTGPLPPLRLHTARYDRQLPAVKHVGLFGTVYLRRAAQHQGFDDVLFVGENELVTEGATWNIGFMDGERITWPAAEVLPGVTMRVVQDLLPSLGLESLTKPVHMSEVVVSPAAFITNAGVGVRAVSSIGDVTLAGATPVIQALQAAYMALPGEPL